MRVFKISQRKSLMARHRAGNRPNKIIRFDSSKPQYPPSYQSWLVLNEKQNKQAEKLVKFKRRKVELDKNLDAELRLSEINVLFELSSDKNYKITKDALCSMAGSLHQLHMCSKFTHWSFKPPRSNRRDSDPQQIHLKELVAAFILGASSESEKAKRRETVARHFGMDRKRKKDWEKQAEEGLLNVDYYLELPIPINDSVIEWAGQKWQMLKRR